jgi:2-oxo-4-hydroxy-4-carboxy-5-ureidoimidazoline decarboxylase
MLDIVLNANEIQKMTLLCAHPQLAGKEAKTGTLTDASTDEQASANLNALSKAELAEIAQLNSNYLEKHGFPFIIAVKNHDKAGIFNEFRKRLNNQPEIEFDTAIQQVGFIANIRLTALFGSNTD